VVEVLDVEITMKVPMGALASIAIALKLWFPEPAADPFMPDAPAIPAAPPGDNAPPEDNRPDPSEELRPEELPPEELPAEELRPEESGGKTSVPAVE